ncbi:DUF5126 domain-containing protein [Sunxiuqinia elliptica]|uniref:F5/8 type C domain-containing protein n=1 Tax=Sunxiuqinia elliptica TaxID=655355 RepID=A0A4R6GRG4_9BACT|nr:DUF5126 domain-containing protein [Sunxiuqinia elliptica]TDN97125.1 F5/8 type C domain-containing protein [Sunxiuqinia elliptica]TDO60690.1 F5/8 type C domain-containing protein [Sunxiuqinia elliptica]
MKQQIILFALLAIFTIQLSCTKKDDSYVITDELIGLTTEADYGAVIFKWQFPESEDIDYVNISYVVDGVGYSKNISRFNADEETNELLTTLEGFADTKEYTFKLTLNNVRGGKSETIVVSETPLMPAYEEVISTINIIPDFGGGIISWENETEKELAINISYPDPENSTNIKMITFFSSESGEDYISGLPASKIDFNVTVADKYDNHSEAMTFSLTPLAEKEILKDNWSILGYVDDSPFETIGYSSQSISDGASPNGRIIAVIDNDKGTFWNADWQHAAKYPHWFIVDLGKEVTISRIVLSRRQGNNKGQKGHQFLTCTNSSAGDVTSPTTWGWEDQGEYDFNINTDEEQSYRLVKNPKARYIKVYFDEKFKGIVNNAMLSDMKVFGQE